MRCYRAVARLPAPRWRAKCSIATISSTTLAGVHSSRILLAITARIGRDLRRRSRTGARSPMIPTPATCILPPSGTGDLVSMRADLLDLTNGDKDLAALDRDVVHLLASWFNRGFLVLRKIDWSTPANILEKIIRYEAVHEIRDWDDLRRRIDPVDRRCYAFFHPALVDEPLIFVEVALTESIPGAIAPLLAEDRKPVE